MRQLNKLNQKLENLIHDKKISIYTHNSKVNTVFTGQVKLECVQEHVTDFYT